MWRSNTTFWERLISDILITEVIIYLFLRLAFLFRLFLLGVLTSSYYIFELAFVKYQADNREVCHFLISLAHPFNGLTGQHTEENEPKPHGATLTKKLCVISNTYAVKGHN